MANATARGNNSGSKPYTRGGHQGHHGENSLPNVEVAILVMLIIPIKIINVIFVKN
jgi:hypothetical protein